MALNNVKVFIDDNYFISLTELVTNNVITIGEFKYGIKSQNTENEPVYCSFKGKYLKQIKKETLDETDSVDSFCYITEDNNKCYIKIVVSKEDVSDISLAKNYIRGLLVEYKLADVVGTGTNKEPLFELTTYLSDGTLVSPTVGMSLNDIARKILAFETNFDINEAGFYQHVIQRAITRK